MAQIPLYRSSGLHFLGQYAEVDDELVPVLKIAGPWFQTTKGFPYRMIGIALEQLDGSVRPIQHNMRLNRLCFALMLEHPDKRVEIARDNGRMYVLTSINGPYARLVHIDKDPLNCKFENLSAKVQKRTLVKRAQVFGSEERHKPVQFVELSDAEIQQLPYHEAMKYVDARQKIKGIEPVQMGETVVETPAVQQQTLKVHEQAADVLKQIYGKKEAGDE